MKILIVDDHPLVLEALRHTLTPLDQAVELHDARTAADARNLVATQTDADLLLLNLGLPEVPGFDLLVEFRERYPSLPVVVLSGSDRRDDVMRAIDLGAMGYIPKTSSSKVMLSALQLVLSGGVYLPPIALTPATPIAARATPQARAKSLTPRELGITDRQCQVLALLLQGKPNKLICRELDLAEGTVKIHVAAILRSLNVNTRTQAVVEASRLGLQIDSLLKGTGKR
ncbi:MAG: response regulator transcription factor [Betaproteobacteria bacterium]|nr:response regulator transcription factor [Betaproteobacteria bacterium]